MSEILQPGSPQEVASSLREASAAKRLVVPRGGGTKTAWGNPGARADIVLSTERLNRIVEHAWADMTATVEAGCTVADLQNTLAEHGQRLAIDPLWPERATIGGILATNDSGALRLRFGSLRDLIIGITVALPDGTLATSGGKVVKNVAGYDLPKLMTGALGTLGVITQAIFRLHPLPAHARTLSAKMASLEAAQTRILAIQDSQLAHSALQVRTGPLPDARGYDPTEMTAPSRQGGDCLVDILLEGTEAGIAAQQKQLPEFQESSVEVWLARQNLWPADDAAIVKFSVLPSQIADAIARLKPEQAVLQATGIGYARLAGARRDLDNMTILTPSPLDAWGDPGDALPLMRAVKQQFDPGSILNRGRYVGGI